MVYRLKDVCWHLYVRVFQIEKTEAELDYLNGQMDSIWASIEELTWTATTSDHISTSLRSDLKSQQSAQHEIEIVLNVISKTYLNRYRSAISQEAVRRPTPPGTDHSTSTIGQQVIDTRKVFEQLTVGGSGTARSSSPSGDSGLDLTLSGGMSHGRSFGVSTLSLNSAGGISSANAHLNGSWSPSESDVSVWTTSRDDMSWTGGSPSPPSSFNRGSRWWWPRRRIFDPWWPYFSQLRPFRRFTGATSLSRTPTTKSKSSRRRSDCGVRSTSTETATARYFDEPQKRPVSSAPKIVTDAASSSQTTSGFNKKPFVTCDFGGTLPGRTASSFARPPRAPRHSATRTESVRQQQQPSRVKHFPEYGQSTSSGFVPKYHSQQSCASSVAGRLAPHQLPTLPPLPTRSSSVSAMRTMKRHLASTASDAFYDDNGSPSLSIQVMLGGGKRAMSSSLSSINVDSRVAEKVKTSTTLAPEDCLVVGGSELDATIDDEVSQRRKSSVASWPAGGVPPFQITIDDADDRSSTISLFSQAPTSPSSPASAAGVSNEKHAIHRRTISQGGALPFQLEVTFSPNL